MQRGPVRAPEGRVPVSEQALLPGTRAVAYARGVAGHDERVKELAARVRDLAAGSQPQAIAAPGDDELGELERAVNALLVRTAARQQEHLLFSVGPVVVFRWQACEGWPVEYVSPNVAALTGYPLEEFASGVRPYASLVHADDLPRVTEEVVSNIAADAPWFVHRPYRILRADGRALWVADYTVSLRDQTGKVTHFFGYIMDISEQVEQMSRLHAQERTIERLASPILQVGRGVLAMPVMGDLAGPRAARMTDDLLAAIGRTRAHTAILDLTGLLDVDSATLEHLLKITRAVGLLGCRGVLSGTSPAIATMIVRLGLGDGSFTAVATLQDALERALTPEHVR